MREKLSKIILPVIVAGLFLFGLGFLTARSRATQDTTPTLYRITYLMTLYPDTYKRVSQGMRIRFVEPVSGQYKEIVYAPDGSIYDIVLVSKQGYFKIINNTLQPFGEFMPPRADTFSEAVLKRVAFGQDEICGRLAYGRWDQRGNIEYWSTPELGINTPIKTVDWCPDFTCYSEKVAVDISKEPCPANFFDSPKLPVDLNYANRFLQDAKDKGNQPGVDRYTQLLEKWKQ